MPKRYLLSFPRTSNAKMVLKPLLTGVGSGSRQLPTHKIMTVIKYKVVLSSRERQKKEMDGEAISRDSTGSTMLHCLKNSEKMTNSTIL